jgi:hypothetical protein
MFLCDPHFNGCKEINKQTFTRISHSGFEEYALVGREFSSDKDMSRDSLSGFAERYSDTFECQQAFLK